MGLLEKGDVTIQFVVMYVSLPNLTFMRMKTIVNENKLRRQIGFRKFALSPLESENRIVLSLCFAVPGSLLCLAC